MVSLNYILPGFPLKFNFAEIKNDILFLETRKCYYVIITHY